jgi:hypothetical protein
LRLSGVDSPAGNLDNGEAGLLERLDVLPLMSETALDQRLQYRVSDFGFAQFAVCDSGIQSGQVMTVEVADEVGGAEAELIV